MLVNQLEGKVTHFSAQLELEKKLMKDVKVGGVVKEIIPPLNLFVNTFAEDGSPLHVDFTEYYKVIVDDSLGEITIHLSTEMYEHYKEQIKLNEVLVFSGFTSTLTRKAPNVGVTVEVSVFAYELVEGFVHA